MEITKSGIRLEGPAEFLGPLYAQSISTDQVNVCNACYDCYLVMFKGFTSGVALRGEC